MGAPVLPPGFHTFGPISRSLSYTTIAASQTDQALEQTSGSGKVGNTLTRLIIVPATSAAGAVSIKDGSGSGITVFAGGGTTALTDLSPIVVELDAVSNDGAWSVTTGANVSVIACGLFT